MAKREKQVKRPKPVDIPQIQTERLLLRNITERDMPFIYRLFSLEETNQFVSFDPVKDMADAWKIYELYCKPKPHLFRLAIVLSGTGELVGTIGLFSIDMENKRATLGYDLLPEHWGKGYMTEAIGAMLKHAFTKMKLNRIQASAEPANVRSICCLERCGFRREGVLRQLDYYKGAYHDDVIYSIIKEEWIS